MNKDSETPSALNTALPAKEGAEKYFFRASAEDFKKIPGSPIAYWIKSTHLFEGEKIGDSFVSGGRNKTHDNGKYLRFFWEVRCHNERWISYANGGDFRKYAGNELQHVDWSDKAISFYDSQGGLCNPKYWNKEGITWSLITSAINSFRIKPTYSQYSSGSPTIFNEKFQCDKKALAFLNSPISYYYLKAINPTLNTTVNDVFALPFPDEIIPKMVIKNTDRCIDVSKEDWNAFETSWDFTGLPLLNPDYRKSTLMASYQKLRTYWQEMTLEMQQLEEENNRIFIEAYGLQDELTPDVPLHEITLTCNPHYRYGKNKTEKEYEILQRTDTIKELISYAIGCMMGRYSLDHPGLIYAHSGNIDFDPLKYKIFPADDDGIIPIMDIDWFKDDATKKFVEFVKIAFPPETFDGNLEFIADNLNPKANESPEDTIRRYFSTIFFKDHMKTYKKRPIYWLFSSGKQKAFECLVYLHRYNESTLSRMRSSYVTPLQGNISARIEFLDHEKDSATNASSQKKIQKQIDVLKKKQVELQSFDDELRHYADMRISLDLDDGVKVNYEKFGNLLAEKKAITGK
ncbi:MAG: BREX-1 system adenine-specific DNA-methyltransferase PglX [Deltaproteobacteria bacterium]|uniref:BREX-1 system adenine-specific DNA-methyltransferase PglX n=1 Tax=Desulfobacula sp. TaxID=2593537 RepID=UPI0019A18764|nr:BREX-1 system adenine-specific DNA-methyltransferase PglX [Candidatus Desulfobacula maris]MBL6994750.1 BREX-1 system adenine-specific DNA-methyltransferase PglX [Desulfobacula sp.]